MCTVHNRRYYFSPQLQISTIGHSKKDTFKIRKKNAKKFIKVYFNGKSTKEFVDCVATFTWKQMQQNQRRATGNQATGIMGQWNEATLSRQRTSEQNRYLQPQHKQLTVNDFPSSTCQLQQRTKVLNNPTQSINPLTQAALC
jgi:hypothetical protein